MEADVFEALVEELSRVSGLQDLPEWIPCTDSDILRYLPTAAEKRKWLRKAKAEITRHAIQERVDEITEVWESRDEIRIRVLMGAFPEDLKLHKNLSRSQRKMWINKAELAACGRSDEVAVREPVVYFISTEDDLIKIGYTTSLRSRIRSLRTASPKELSVLLVVPGSRDDERQLHNRFEAFRVGRQWFRRCDPIMDFIASRSDLAPFSLAI
jgi:hypothetical protein